MRKTILVLFILLAAACASPAVPSSTTPAPRMTSTSELVVSRTAGSIPLTEAEVPRVTVEEAKAAFDSGQAILVDVRRVESFEMSHIAGAINLQLGEFETNPRELDLDKEQWIITYCT